MWRHHHHHHHAAYHAKYNSQTRTFGERRPDPQSASDPHSGSGRIPEFSRDFLGQRYICGKISMNIRSVFLAIWAKVWKNVLSRNVKESFKNSSIRIHTRGWLPKFNEFFIVHRHSCGEIFTKMGSVVFTWVASKQTDKQTNKQTDTQTPDKTLPLRRK